MAKGKPKATLKPVGFWNHGSGSLRRRDPLWEGWGQKGFLWKVETGKQSEHKEQEAVLSVSVRDSSPGRNMLLEGWRILSLQAFRWQGRK